MDDWRKTQMDCKKLICSENSTIREVMACINNNSKGIVFVVNGEKRLSGIATDGDIRQQLHTELHNIVKTFLQTVLYIFLCLISMSIEKHPSDNYLHFRKQLP